MATMTKEQIQRDFAKARKAQEAGEYGAAKRTYARLSKAAPNLAEIPYNLGLIARAELRFPDATSYFEKALQLRPSESAIWFSYFELATHHPDISGLKKLMARAGDVVSHVPAYLYFQGVVAVRSGAPEAVELLRAALSKGYETALVHIELGAALEMQGQAEAALASYDAALDLVPDHVLALSRKTAVLRDLGRKDQALETARKTIAC